MATAARKAGESASLPAFEQLEGFAAFNGAMAGTLMKVAGPIGAP